VRLDRLDRLDALGLKVFQEPLLILELLELLDLLVEQALRVFQEKLQPPVLLE